MALNHLNMGETKFDRLTDGQKECLRLFHARWEVKNIARHIGRSPVTVNQRLAAARRHLGVDRSAEAARLLFQYEGGMYEPPIYEPEIVVLPPVEAALLADSSGEGKHIFPLPFPTGGRPHNEMTFTVKLFYSLVLAAIIALVFGGCAAALSSLSEMF